MSRGRDLLATLLRHEAKSNTYKFALIRALNDLALEHPVLTGSDVVVPLRRVAERWLVYYWPFVGFKPIYQGARAQRGGSMTQDISFRPALTALRQAWETLPFASSDPAQGALLLTEYRAGRRQLPDDLQQQTILTVQAIMQAVKQPLRFAGGTGAHGLFSTPAPAASLAGHLLPGTTLTESCFVVPAAIWQALQELSLWVEALCLHEWSLYVEKVRQEPEVSRGEVFTLLTAEPEGRIPLNWERHQVKLLMLEGQTFHCPWTLVPLTPERFDLDHLIPVSTFPINELWNLLPSDPVHNSHVKRHRIPGAARLLTARPVLSEIFQAYETGTGTRPVLSQDVAARFGALLSPTQLADQSIQLAEVVAQARNVPRY